VAPSGCQRPLQRLGEVEEYGWLVALLATPLGAAFSGSVVTLDGALDNWFGPWPPAELIGDAEVPTEERRPAAERKLPGYHLRYLRAKCCGCTEAFQASRAGSIPVARSADGATRAPLASRGPGGVPAARPVMIG
jgi:hypothetical protein